MSLLSNHQLPYSSALLTDGILGQPENNGNSQGTHFPSAAAGPLNQMAISNHPQKGSTSTTAHCSLMFGGRSTIFLAISQTVCDPSLMSCNKQLSLVHLPVYMKGELFKAAFHCKASFLRLDKYGQNMTKLSLKYKL